MSIRKLVITMFHWFAVRSPEISLTVHLPVLLLTLVKFRGLNPLSPKSDENLISPYNVTAESSIKIMRIKEMYREQIGHVTRQEASIAKTAMHWTPEGKRKRGRPKITWRRTVEKEIKEMGKTWEGIKFMARDRQMWREHVAALHAC